MTEKSTHTAAEPELQIVKASVCQHCGGWVRIAALAYFKTNTRARNEFMKEVATYNLSVQEMPIQEWREKNIDRCACNSGS
jgi:hypothetical protein